MARKAKKKRFNWIYIAAGVLLTVGLIYWLTTSKATPTNQTTQKELSANLLKANKLTQDVFYYVEQVEMKKMTQEEANKLSNPIKVELQNIRNQLSQQELMYNDSVRKALGNIMVDNVMKWRAENGLIVPEENITE